MTEQELNQMVEDKTEETAAQDFRRYVLAEIVDNKEEIQTIAENTIKVMTRDYNDFRLGMWELIPIVSMEYMKCMIDYLATRKTTEVESIEIEVGQSFTMGIEYTTGLGEKDGSFNPFIHIGEELKLNGIPFRTGISQNGRWVVPTIEENVLEIKDISFDTIAALKRKFRGQITNEWGAISLVTIYFLREMKLFLDNIKTKHDLFEINVGNVFTMGVEATISDEDESKFDYHTFIIPGQVIKLATKDDKLTERE